MRIRITRKPTGHVEGIDVSSLRVGTIYEVSHELGSALLLLGYARVEMRRAERRAKARITADRRIKIEASLR